MKHPARGGSRSRSRSWSWCSAWCSRSMSAPIPQQDAQQSHLVGKAAPTFDLPDLSGGRVTLADIAGKSAIVNFWNSWCIPCLEEAPALKKFYAAHKDDSDFAMIGIVATGRDRRRTGVRAQERHRLDDRARSRQPGRTRLRARAVNRRPSRSPRAASSPRASTEPMSASELETFLAAARDVG